MPAPLPPPSPTSEEGTDVESLPPGDGDGGEAEEAPQVEEEEVQPLNWREEKKENLRVPPNVFENEEVAKIYECQICFDVPLLPFHGHACEHLFCEPCLSLSRNRGMGCPVCLR